MRDLVFQRSRTGLTISRPYMCQGLPIEPSHGNSKAAGVRTQIGPGMVVHTFGPHAPEAGSLSLRPNLLLCIANSRPAIPRSQLQVFFLGQVLGFRGRLLGEGFLGLGTCPGLRQASAQEG